MRKSRLSLVKQARLIEHFVAGTTARCAADLIGVNRNTAAYYFQRLREIIVDELEQESYETFDGEIEVDESYFGGARKGSRGRGAAGKVPVFGLIKTARVFPIIIGAKAPNANVKMQWQGLHQDYSRCEWSKLTTNYRTQSNP